MTAASRERAALVKTMRSVGPDAPTLCGEWTTRDLAAHLVLRERRPDAAAGILVPALAGYTARKQQRLAGATDWPDLLEMVASGPPVYSPLKLLDPLVNTTEMFIHHEDVRRATPDWQPRDLDSDLASALRRQVRLAVRMSLGSPIRDGDAARLRRDNARVRRKRSAMWDRRAGAGTAAVLVGPRRGPRRVPRRRRHCRCGARRTPTVVRADQSDWPAASFAGTSGRRYPIRHRPRTRRSTASQHNAT